MAQYQTGTVTVTQTDATVTGVGTSWLTEVSAGDWFRRSGDLVSYTVASVTSDTELELTAPYSGATGSGAGYQITRDFSDTLGLPLMTAGDRGTDVLWNRAMQLLDDISLGAFDALQADAITEKTLDNGVLIEGNLHKDAGITVRSGQTESYIIDYYNATTDAAIGGLTGGTSFGGIVRAPNLGHFVIGIRDDEVTDSFSIISGGGNFSGDVTYDKLVAQFKADGTSLLNGDVVMGGNQYRSVSNDNATWSGGSSADLGGNIVAYGESHATNAGDIQFRSGTNNRLLWDESASYWFYYSARLASVASVDRGQANSYLSLSGGSNENNGGNIVAYGESHATNANDMIFRAGTTPWLTWDDSAQNTIFSGNIVVSGDRMYRDVNNDQFIIAGGDGPSDGGNVFFYGSANVSNPGDILLRSSATNVLFYDHSATNWDFQGTNVSGVGLLEVSSAITSESSAADLLLTGDVATSLGGNLTLFGSTHATNANDIRFRSNTTDVLLWDNSASKWLFGTNGIQAYRINGYNSTGELIVAGGSGGTVGGRMILYAQSHATQADDIEFYASGTRVALWDNSATRWDFQDHLLYNVQDLYGASDTAALEIYGSTSTSSANILLYGGTHSTRAFDMAFRYGGTEWFAWDNSFAGATLTGKLAVTNRFAVGVTTPDIDWGVSFATMQLGDTGAFMTSTSGVGMWNGTNWYYDGTNYRYRTSAGATQHSMSAASHTFRVVASGVVDEIITWSDALNITSATATFGVDIDLQSNNMNGVDYITRGNGTDTIGVSGGSATGAGGNIILYGESHATNAGDILFRSNTTDILIWDESANGWNFLQTEIINAPSLRRAIATSTLDLSGGSTVNLGANIKLFGETHATQANDFLFRVGTTDILLWDNSGSLWDFQGTNIGGINTIRRGVTSDNLFVSGGSNTSSGGNIVMYGESHGSQAGDIAFRSDTSLKALFDASLDLWDWQSKAFNNVGALGCGDIDSVGYVSTDDLLALTTEITAPAAPSTGAVIYLDSADSDLKVKFANGTVVTLASN